MVQRIGAAEGLSSLSVRAVLPDGDALWIGTTAGLVRWHDGRARRYTAADGVPDGSVQVLYRDAQGTIWSGTDRGMTALSPDGGTRAWLGEQDFPGQNAFDFLRDPSGDLWIASDRGLLRLRGERFQVYDHRVGLPRDKVFCVIDDGRGYLWLSSNHGVFGLRGATSTRSTPAPASSSVWKWWTAATACPATRATAAARRPAG